MKLLLDKGADPNIPCNIGWTNLMMATSNKNAQIVKLLLSFDHVNVDAQNDVGDTALIRATVLGLLSFVKKLLKRGADTSIKDKKGKIAMDYSTDNKITELLKNRIVTESNMPTDAEGNVFPLLIEKPKKVITIKAICIGKSLRTKVLIEGPQNYCVWNKDKEKWKKGYVFDSKGDFEVEITNEKIQYHLHPTVDGRYIRFEKLVLSDGTIMTNLY
jgi:hypothetical protein